MTCIGMSVIIDIVSILLMFSIASAQRNDGIGSLSSGRETSEIQREIVADHKDSGGSLRGGIDIASKVDPRRETSTLSSMLSLQGSHCSCNSCDEVAWSTDAAGHTCGARISYLQTFDPASFSIETDACARVAGIEYPNECGACNPASCDGRVPPTPTRATYCGCSTCTTSVWKSLVDNVSCEAHVTWVQQYEKEKVTEDAACKVVSDKFPSSQCGQLCNPTSCPKLLSAENFEVTCGCPNCTPEILSRVADSYTCRDRILFLMGSVSETDACSAIAGVEFPDICGAQCDPARCRNDVVPAAPQVPNVFGPSSGDADQASASPVRSPTSIIVTPPVFDPPVNGSPIGSTPTFGSDDFGTNVYIFDPTMSTSSIQAVFDSVYIKQVNNEMGSERYGMYFMPGTYGTIEEPLALLIGYYTEVVGLGISPTDVVINGKIEVYNRCFEADPYNAGKFIPTSADQGGLCFALNNFWRTLANLSINIVHRASLDSCRKTAMFWAISQASSMRRVDIQGGDISLMDYCTNPGFSSGGFIADSRHTGTKVINGSQQQFCARNMAITAWQDGVWNQVFLGVIGAPDDSTYPDPPFTTFDTNPLSREKPYICIENDIYYIRVPAAKSNSRGITWGAGTTDGISIPLTSFYVAKPGDTIDKINAALISGKHLLLTPGVYRIRKSIIVRKANTVVLGLGHATLLAVNGAIPLVLRDRPGIIVSGITFDAGTVESPVLLQVGARNSTTRNTNSLNPTTLHDIYFRVGGPYVGKANICLEINSHNVLVDHTWIWRADHGIETFDSTNGFDGDNERWETNIGRNGLVVNGDDVTMTGLFVEHYQEYNVIWKGERGRVYFFQNELPYDPPSQDEWRAEDGTLGWAGYKVTNDVTQHELHGGGVYCYNRNNPTITTQNGFETPTNVAGIKMERVYTRNLSGPGKIISVINGVGETVDATNKGPQYVI